MKKVLFIDRDGTLVIEPPIDYQLDSFEKLAFYPKVFQYLSKIVKELDFELVLVTNQDGLGTDRYPEDTFWPVHNFVMSTFEKEGIVFKEQIIDRTFAADNAPTRKPNTGLLTEYIKGEYDLTNSYVIGDRLTDVELAKNLKAKGIFINTHPEVGAEEISVKKEELDDPGAIIRLQHHDTGRIGLRQTEALLLQTAPGIREIEHDPRRLFDGVALNICRGWLAEGQPHLQLRAGQCRKGNILDHSWCRCRRNAPETAHQQTDPASWHSANALVGVCSHHALVSLAHIPESSMVLGRSTQPPSVPSGTISITAKKVSPISTILP